MWNKRKQNTRVLEKALEICFELLVMKLQIISTERSWKQQVLKISVFGAESDFRITMMLCVFRQWGALRPRECPRALHRLLPAALHSLLGSLCIFQEYLKMGFPAYLNRNVSSSFQELIVMRLWKVLYFVPFFQHRTFLLSTESHYRRSSPLTAPSGIAYHQLYYIIEMTSVNTASFERWPKYCSQDPFCACGNAHFASGGNMRGCS